MDPQSARDRARVAAAGAAAAGARHWLAVAERTLRGAPDDMAALQLAHCASMNLADEMAGAAGEDAAQDRRRYADAIEYGAAVLRRLPAGTEPQAVLQTARCLSVLGRYDEALALLVAALAADPDRAAYAYGAASTCWRQGDWEGCRAFAERGDRARQRTADDELHRCAIRLHLGEWADALFSTYALRRRQLLDVGDPCPWARTWQWQGERVDTLLVVRGDTQREPGGYGDGLQAASLLGELSARVARVLFDAPASLLALVRESARRWPTVRVLDLGAGPLPPHDAACSYFEATVAAVGRVDGGEPVLVPPAGRRTAPALPAGVNIGLAWAGLNARRERADAASKSVSLGVVAPPLLAVPGVTVHSLQVGPEAAELDAFPTIRRYEFRDFADTARLAVELDAVVAVDCAAAHLCAGAGVPTFLLLARAAAWRWGPAGETTPWYKSMRLLRQTEAGDWPSVARRAAEMIARGDLPPRLGAAADVSRGAGVPVAPPESGLQTDHGESASGSSDLSAFARFSEIHTLLKQER